MDHLVLADPLVGKHNAVMGCVIKVKDVFEAEFHLLVFTAEGRVRIVMSRREVSNQVVSVVHLDVVAAEQFEELLVTDLVAVNHDTHVVVLDDIDVFFTDKLVAGAETISVLERLKQVSHTVQLVVLSSMAAFRRMSLGLEVFNNDRFARAYLETILFDTLAKEDLNSLLVTNLDMTINSDALSRPKVVKVALAKPFFSSLRMEEMMSLQTNALIMSDVSLELVVANHSFAK